MCFRKSLFAILVVFSYVNSYSQDFDFPDSDTSSLYTGFASFFLIPTYIVEGPTIYMGGMGAVLINERFIIGGYGMRKTGQTYVVKGSYDGKMLGMGNGGIITGYSPYPGKRVRPVFQTCIGWGGISIASNDSKGYAITEKFNRIIVLSPSISADVRLFSFVWLSLGVNYLYLSGIDIDGYTPNDFNKFGGYISLKAITGN